MSKSLENFRLSYSWLVKAQMAASVIALAAICLLTFSLIVTRELLSSSILWAEEVSLLLMKVVVFQGAAGMYAARAFIVVDGLTSKLSRRFQFYLQVLAWIVMGGFSSVAAFYGLETYPSQIQIRSYLLEMPKFYFMVPLIIGSVSIMLTSVYYLLATLTFGILEDASVNENGFKPLVRTREYS